MPENGLHGKQIDAALEFVFASDRILDCYWAGAEALANRVDSALEVGAHLVHLIDEANAGHAVIVGLAPDGFRLRLDPVYGVEDGDCSIEHTQRALYLGGEIHVPRRVNDIDE